MRRRRAAQAEPLIGVPMPPAASLEQWEIPVFVRDQVMEEFLRRHWIDDGGVFALQGHFSHLAEASIGVLWANVKAPVPGSHGTRTVAGMAEIYQARPAKRWIMERQNAYMHQLFGFELPNFVLTFDARYFAADTVTVATKLAVITHELCHLQQAKDRYGEPRFNSRTGEPAWSIAPHDVEQFNLVVEWFGAEAAGASELVAAAQRAPLMLGQVQAFSCGTCGKAA